MEDEEPETDDPVSGASAMSSGAFLRALAEAPPVGHIDRTGQRLAHFELGERLGRGGMGEVYVARDEKLKRRVAVKVMRPEVTSDPERRARFLQEARAAAAVTHRHIVTIHEVGEWEDDVFIAMELLEGVSLREKLATEAPLALGETQNLLRMMARGVRKAHRAGIVHRDLKPDNVMLSEDDDVKLLDFGLAKLRLPHDRDESGSVVTTEDGRVMGTPGYMSPEQGTGKDVDHRTDIFSLGVIAYEMVTGRRPFVGDSSMDVIIATSRDEPPLPSELRAEASALEPLILRCLAKDPGGRFDDLDAFLDALEAVELDPPASTEPPRAAEQTRRPVWLLPVAVALAGAGAIATWVNATTEPSPPLSPPAQASARPSATALAASEPRPAPTPPATTPSAIVPVPSATLRPMPMPTPRPVVVPRAQPTSTPRPKSTGVNLGI